MRVMPLPADANAGHFFLDYLVTGFLIARGSNAVHDALALIEKANRALGGVPPRA